MAKYLPPMLSGQFPAEAMGEGLSVVPIPPMLEDVPDFDALRAAATQREDDLCDIGTLLLTDDSQRLVYATQACQEYGQLYARYRERWPEAPLPRPANPLPQAPRLMWTSRRSRRRCCPSDNVSRRCRA